MTEPSFLGVVGEEYVLFLILEAKFEAHDFEIIVLVDLDKSSRHDLYILLYQNLITNGALVRTVVRMTDFSPKANFLRSGTSKRILS